MEEPKLKIDDDGIPRKLISRKDAVTQNLKTYFTGKPCTHGHVTLRYASSGACTSCSGIKKISEISQTEKRRERRGRSTWDEDTWKEYRRNYYNANKNRINARRRGIERLKRAKRRFARLQKKNEDNAQP